MIKMSTSPEDFIKGTAKAYDRVSKIALKTPLLKSLWLSNLTGCNVYMKMESEQITRSFKIRGAVNKMSSVIESGADNVVTASSGNHGLACAYAGSKLGVCVTIYCPLTASPAKLTAIQSYSNATVTKHGDECAETESYARSQANNKNIPYMSPYNDVDNIFGQATIAYEILEDLPDVNAVFIPVGGGGLASGISGYLKATNKDIVTIGCQPEGNAAMYHCIQADRILEDNSFLKDTLADGVAGGVEPGAVTFDLCKQNIDKWSLVGEDEIEKAVFDMIDKEKKLVEGAACLAIAALLRMKAEFQGKNVVLIMCGGNINTSVVASVCSKFLS
ncbi:L-threonine dehydratase catabolic TdcB-like isoform X2 [Clytia hemisphaerica]